MPSIVITIGTMSLFRGIAQVTLGDEALTTFPPDYLALGQSYFINLPPTPLSFLIFLVLAIGFAVFLHGTATGRRLFAIGANPVAARFSGIRVDRLRFALFTLSGLLSGLAAVLLTARIGVMRPNIALGWELDVITMVVLGGVAISGGVGYHRRRGPLGIRARPRDLRAVADERAGHRDQRAARPVADRLDRGPHRGPPLRHSPLKRIDAMAQLEGKVAWVTGAGSGIGEAAALALAQGGRRGGADGPTARSRWRPWPGASRRRAALPWWRQATSPNRPWPEPWWTPSRQRFGRLDILVNNAGSNITARRWDQLSGDGIDQVINTNLSAAFYCAAAALKPMRRQRDGVLIHTASWAGKYISPLSGPAYTAAKHAVVAMSQTINMEEWMNNIRSTAMLPAEIATPILDSRPKPPSAEERTRMLQPQDMADLILFIATRPASVCLNEVVISPTFNRMYAA